MLGISRPRCCATRVPRNRLNSRASRRSDARASARGPRVSGAGPGDVSRWRDDRTTSSTFLAIRAAWRAMSDLKVWSARRFRIETATLAEWSIGSAEWIYYERVRTLTRFAQILLRLKRVRSTCDSVGSGLRGGSVWLPPSGGRGPSALNFRLKPEAPATRPRAIEASARPGPWSPLARTGDFG